MLNLADDLYLEVPSPWMQSSSQMMCINADEGVKAKDQRKSTVTIRKQLSEIGKFETLKKIVQKLGEREHPQLKNLKSKNLKRCSDHVNVLASSFWGEF